MDSWFGISFGILVWNPGLESWFWNPGLASWFGTSFQNSCFSSLGSAGRGDEGARGRRDDGTMGQGRWRGGISLRDRRLGPFAKSTERVNLTVRHSFCLSHDVPVSSVPPTCYTEAALRSSGGGCASSGGGCATGCAALMELQRARATHKATRMHSNGASGRLYSAGCVISAAVFTAGPLI